LTRSLQWTPFSALRSEFDGQDEMAGSEKDRLAAMVIDRHCAFERALAASRRRYPTRDFRSFAAVMRQYVQATREDEMLHRNVVKAAHGLVEYLQCERKRVPDEVLLEAERLDVCSSSATIRISTAMSLLVCDLARAAFRRSYRLYLA
jgi:hypothetical protein